MLCLPQGFIKISFNVVLKDLKKFGYDVCPQTLRFLKIVPNSINIILFSRLSEYPLPNFEEEFNKHTNIGHVRAPLLPVRESSEENVGQEARAVVEQVSQHK